MKDKRDFTPGPWHTSQFQPGEIFSEDGRMRLEKDGTTLYPIAKTFDFDGESEANARLIAAAPELLEACEMVSKSFSECYDTDAQGPLAKARAAIAKALGE